MECAVKRKSWYEANPALYEEVRKQINGDYQNLHFSTLEGVIFLRGSFPLKDGEYEVDRYSIEIKFPSNYPRDLPLVREIGGRIPRTGDRHVYVDGMACLFLPDQRAWICPEGTSFLDFLNGPVRNYFLSQSVFELEGVWPFGERSHGVQGIVEFYSEILGTGNTAIITRYLEALSKKAVKGHWPCPCGSGERLRHCHIKKILELRQKIPAEVAFRSSATLLPPRMR